MHRRHDAYAECRATNVTFVDELNDEKKNDQYSLAKSIKYFYTLK